jgi:hypothetical protein
MPIPIEDDRLEDWWLSARDRLTLGMVANFDALVLLCTWELWKNRNAMVFNNVQQQRTMVQLVDLVIDNFRVWTWARRGVAGSFHVRVGVG